MIQEVPAMTRGRSCPRARRARIARQGFCELWIVRVALLAAIGSAEEGPWQPGIGREGQGVTPDMAMGQY